MRYTVNILGSWRNSLADQWLGLCTLIAQGLDSIAGQGTKIPHAVQCNPCPPPTPLPPPPTKGKFFVWQGMADSAYNISLVFLFFAYHAHEICSKMTTPCFTIFPHHSELNWHCLISIETSPTPSDCLSYLSSVYDMVFTAYSLQYVICFSYYTVI